MNKKEYKIEDGEIVLGFEPKENRRDGLAVWLNAKWWKEQQEEKNKNNSTYPLAFTDLIEEQRYYDTRPHPPEKIEEVFIKLEKSDELDS